MNFDALIAKYNGTVINDYGGECVALIAHYCIDNGKPLAYANAKDWWLHPALTGAFEFIQNNPTDYNQVPLRGDVVIWNGALAGSGGYGHIAVYDAKVSPGIFRSLDNNWGGRYVHFVTHNYNNVQGWFRPKQVSIPQGGNMTTAEAQKIVTGVYRGLFGREPDAGGLANYTNRLMAGDADGTFRDIGGSAELRNKVAGPIQAQVDSLTKSINEQNRVITELNTSGTATKAQLQEAVAKLAELNAQLTTATDTIKDLQNNPDTQLLDQGKGVFAWITKLLNRLKG